MAYRLQHDEAVVDGIGRIARDQLEHALDDLEARIDDDPNEAVHDCRKRCKKIRGAARLVRPALGNERYRTINVLARDAAREIAGFRDAAALAETFERLVAAVGLDHADGVEDVRSVLQRERVDAEHSADRDHEAVDRAVAHLRRLGTELDALHRLETPDGWDAVAPGLAKSYGRGRSAMSDVLDRPEPARFHEWRKRAKYTRYHLRLIRPVAPEILRPLERSFHHLTDALGDAHDLAVMSDRLEASDAFARSDATRFTIEGARADLEHRATAFGRLLYAESPKRFVRRLGTYWGVWSRSADLGPAGDIERVLTRA